MDDPTITTTLNSIPWSYFDPVAGHEVARTFVPEPAPPVLLGLGVAALGASVLHRLTRARA